MSLSKDIDEALLKSLPYLEREGLTVGNFAELKEDLAAIINREIEYFKQTRNF